MNNSILSTATWLAVSTAVLAVPAFAASGTTNGGSTPKGQPFVEIQGQIIEVQGTILTLEEKVDAVIADLADADAQIDALWAEIERLEGEVAAGLGDHADLIAALQAKVAEIENNQYVSGECGEGQAVVSITKDTYGGQTVVCRDIAASAGALEVQRAIASAKYWVPAGTSTVVARCPEGFVMTGGASRGQNNKVLTDGPESFFDWIPNGDPNSWYVLVPSGSGYTQGTYFHATAICLKLGE